MSYASLLQAEIETMLPVQVMSNAQPRILAAEAPLQVAQVASNHVDDKEDKGSCDWTENESDDEGYSLVSLEPILVRIWHLPFSLLNVKLSTRDMHVLELPTRATRSKSKGAFATS